MGPLDWLLPAPDKGGSGSVGPAGLASPARLGSDPEVAMESVAIRGVTPVTAPTPRTRGPLHLTLCLTRWRGAERESSFVLRAPRSLD